MARDGPFNDAKQKLEEQKPEGLVLNLYSEGNINELPKETTSGFQNKTMLMKNFFKG